MSIRLRLDWRHVELLMHISRKQVDRLLVTIRKIEAVSYSLVDLFKFLGDDLLYLITDTLLIDKVPATTICLNLILDCHETHYGMIRQTWWVGNEQALGLPARIYFTEL